ncbi:MAG: tetratricopeptide repeat protein [Phycisphaerales bacterium]|nr:MAG: tetratricopeptide repeat protein [Phycisphaerales bacterium]
MTGGFRGLVVTAVLLVVVCGASAVQAKLVAYWKFDDANGAAAVDKVGGHTGKLVGGPAWVGGYFGGALSFDGIDDYVDCGGGKIDGDPNTWADIVDEITVAAWIKVDAFTKEWQAIVAKGDSTWRLARGASTNRVQFDGTGLTGINWGVGGGADINDGKWHHVAGVYDGSDAYMYVDAVLVGGLANVKRIKSNNFDVYIGENGEPRGRQWHGVIDEVVIFDHALSEEQLKQLQELGGESFLSEDLRTLGALLQDSQNAPKEPAVKQAAVLIEEKVAEAERLTQKRGEPIEDPYRIVLSRLYFALAKAREASGAAPAVTAATYKKSALETPKSPHYGAALLWLFKNVPADDYSDVIRQGVRNTVGAWATIGPAVADFEVEGDWPAFRLFLDTVFSEVEDSAGCARLVASNLKQDGVWANSFARYCREKPELRQYVAGESVKLAEQAVTEGELLKAAEIYRDISGRCEDNQKIGYAFRVCECVFESGKSAKAISEIESFVKKYRAVDRSMVMQAILLKGRTYLQLNETDKASDIFLDLMIDYPEAKKTPEANFFMGYCSMLQGNFEEAGEAFDLVIKDYPDNTYASKARLCKRRMAKKAN